MNPIVSLKKLINLEELGTGNFGKVYRVRGFSLPGETRDLAFKHFTVDSATQALAAQAAVAMRDALSPAERAELDGFAAWPVAVVEDNGLVCGLLMPLIPGDFFCETLDPEQVRPVTVRKPRDTAWLAAADRFVTNAGHESSSLVRTDRICLLRDVCAAFAWLHRHEWCFGDLSFSNLVYAVNPPRIMLIDCDGAASVRNTRRNQGHSLGWHPPECSEPPSSGQRLQDARSDVYKLGLFALRILRPGEGATTALDPEQLVGELDDSGVSLIRRAVSSDPSLRPDAAEMARYFGALAYRLVEPPKVAYAKLKESVIVRGQDVEIEWRLENRARLITILHGNDSRIELEPDMHPDGYRFRPTTSGPISINVANRYGSVEVKLDPLVLVELPPFDLQQLRLPRPFIPSPTVLVPVPELPERPAGALAAPLLPQLPHVEVFSVVAQILPDDWLPVSVPSFGSVMAEASQTIITKLTLAGMTEPRGTRLRRRLGRSAASSTASNSART